MVCRCTTETVGDLLNGDRVFRLLLTTLNMGDLLKATSAPKPTLPWRSTGLQSWPQKARVPTPAKQSREESNLHGLYINMAAQDMASPRGQLDRMYTATVWRGDLRAAAFEPGWSQSR